jgi:hypothetical protein
MISMPGSSRPGKLWVIERAAGRVHEATQDEFCRVVEIGGKFRFGGEALHGGIGTEGPLGEEEDAEEDTRCNTDGYAHSQTRMDVVNQFGVTAP